MQSLKGFQSERFNKIIVTEKYVSFAILLHLKKGGGVHNFYSAILNIGVTTIAAIMYSGHCFQEY